MVNQEKIIYFHMNQLGDLLFSLPVLYSFRKHSPNAKITSFVRHQLASVIKNSGFIDEIILKPGCMLSKLKTFRTIKNRNFNKAIMFSESPETLFYGFFANIPERIGFDTSSLSFLLTDKVERSGVPSIKNNNNIAKKLNLKDVPNNYVGLLTIPQFEFEYINEWIKDKKLDQTKIIIIAPGSSKRRKNKSWHIENWKKVMEKVLLKKYTPVLIGAPYEKKQLQTLANYFNPAIETFIVNDGLLKVAALMKESCAFIGIDSGAMHLAACVELPVVAIFGKTDPLQIGPQPLDNHQILKNNEINKITPDEIIEKLELILK